MIHSIGELYLQGGRPLLKMWRSDVAPAVRPFVRHSHTYFEITVVNSGSGEYTTEHRVYPMQPGDVFVFASNEVHYITRVGPEGLSITNLHFEPRYLAERTPDAENDSRLQFCFSHTPDFHNRIAAQHAAVLRDYHKRIREELSSGATEYPTAVKACLNLMLIELLRRHGYRVLQDIPGSLQHLLAVYDYIEKHLTEDLRLETLAGIAGLSPNYFSHLFRQINGISLWDYIIAKRIEKAMTLILSENNRRNMTEIALLCGFNNTVNFNKAFKKHKGITPSQLKKNPNLQYH